MARVGLQRHRKKMFSYRVNFDKLCSLPDLILAPQIARNICHEKRVCIQSPQDKGPEIYMDIPQVCFRTYLVNVKSIQSEIIRVTLLSLCRYVLR